MSLALAKPPILPSVPLARPFLKWVGGKTQIKDVLLRYFPASFNHYYEPFLGGGAIFFHLQPQQATLSDCNHQLIHCYQAIRDNVEAVIESLKVHQKHQTQKAYFYRIRAQNPQTLSPAAQAARLIYLNKTCYNGLYRVNRQGQFNVPFGAYKKPNCCQTLILRAVAKVLQHVHLLAQSAFEAVIAAQPGDLVYFDPPYAGGFTQYSSHHFGANEQAQLSDLFFSLARKGVFVVASNADTPLIRSLYRGCLIKQVMARRMVNCHAEKRGHVSEVIIIPR